MADLNSQLFQQLAQFALGPIPSRARKPSDYEIALQIMMNSRGHINAKPWDPSLGGGPIKKGGKDDGPGVLSRIIDVVARPLYASANAYKESGGLSSGFGLYKSLITGDVPENPLDALAAGVRGGWEGFTGKEKTTYSQLIKQSDDVPEFAKKGVPGFITGLGADILGDPLTYVPIVGPTKAAVRGGAAALGKAHPAWADLRHVKQARKAAKVGAPRITDPPVISPNVAPQAFRFSMREGQEMAPKALPKNMQVTLPQDIPIPPAMTQAMREAPVVNTALEQGTKEAAIAERTLSAQQAAMHGKEFDKEAKEILEAAEASQAAKKTYQELMDSITFTARGPLQNAIDRNASRLTIPMHGPLQKKFRGPGGRFLPKSTMLPLAPTHFRFGPPSSTSTASIKSLGDVQKAAYRAGTPRTRPAQKTTYTVNIPRAEVKATPKGIFGPVNSAVSKAIRDNAGIAVTKLKPGETIDEQTVTRGIMARFATHMGQKDVRPLVLDHMTSAMARSGERYRKMEQAFKNIDEDDALEAWDLARGAKPYGLASSPEMAQLGDTLRGLMEEFFRSRAIPENVAKGNSVAMRTGMTMKDINRTLARYDIPFRFTNKTATDPITQTPISYEKGTNWLISWETHAPETKEQLMKFIFGLQSAGEQLAAEYAFLDDVAYRMGSRGKTATHRFRVEHPRLVDYYFDKDVAQQLATAIKTMGEAYSPKSDFGKFLRKSISLWKTGVTIYSPRHHIQNMIGDVFLAWQAGVNDPRVFAKAAKVMHANRKLYSDISSVNELVGANAVRNVLAKPGAVVAKNKAGQEFTAQQVYIGMFNLGLLQRASAVEDIVKGGIPLPGRLGKPFGGKVHDVAAGVAETREHFVKIAHFIDAIQKTRGTNVRQIFEDAGHEVRKWHPDGLDLTKTEQAIRTLAIPFYSWMRKSTPLIIEGALMRPQKAFTAYAKVNYNLQQTLGIEGTTLSNPYPEDQLFPAWLKEENVPVLGRQGMPGLAGFIGSLGRQGVDDEGNPIPNAYTMLGPTNPVQDLFSQFGGFRSFGETKDAFLSSATPFARIPLELQQGRELFTDIPLEGRYQDYATNQIPLVNQFARMTNIGPFGPTKRAEKYGIGSQEATANFFLNTNLTGTGPHIKSAEFEMIPKKREENKKIRKFAEEELGYPMKGKGRIPEWLRQLYYERNGGQG